MGSCFIAIAKTTSKEIAALIRSMKFLSPQKWICKTVGPSLAASLEPDRLHDFSVTISRVIHRVNSFFPCTAGLWNSLSIEFFPFTYDLNSFKSGINGQHLMMGSF